MGRGAVIEVVLGDITRQAVDAIVNAANSSLLGGGGVDGAIHGAAGPALLAECRELRRTRLPDGLPVGQAVATGGGDLAARWVIHTVGPNRHAGQTDPALLASCVESSLAEAVRVGARTVAIPAVSAGVYGWDADEVARVAVATAAASPQREHLDLVRFVLFGDAVFAAFEDALHQATPNDDLRDVRPSERATSTRRNPMSEEAERYRKVAAQFDERVRAVPGDGWDRPAPCEGWVARDVVRHLVDWVPGLFCTTWDLPMPSFPSVDDDPAGAWAELDRMLREAFDDPAIATAVRDTPLGRLTFEQTADQIVTNDVFLHTWDLARATGLDETLDPDEVHRLLEGMEPMDEALRSSGHFGPRVPVPDDADEQTRLIAFIGRQP